MEKLGEYKTPKQWRREKLRIRRAKSNELFLAMLAEIKSTKPEKSDIVELVEDWRKQRGFMIGQMADLLGVNHAQYSRFKNGKVALPKRAMYRAYLLQIPADQIILGINEVNVQDEEESKLIAEFEA